MRYRSLMFTCAALIAGSIWPSPLGAKELTFEPVTIDPEPGKVVYAVTIADVNGDGREDIVAVTEDRVLWYRSPDWERHVILEGQTATDNVCIAPLDINGDHRIDFALGAGWPRNGGTIQWLEQGDDAGHWTVHPIAAIPWTHRMRFANVLGREDGRPQLVVSPLNAEEGEAGVALTAYTIPPDPTKDRWQPTVLSHNLNRMHNHWCASSRELGGSELANESAVTLAAGREGVFAIYLDPEVGEAAKGKSGLGPDAFAQEKLADGASSEEADQRGAGEVKTGTLANGRNFLATIEPMHGTDAVVYRLDNPSSAALQRTVLTDRLRGGHALWVADIDKDGDDEIVVGWREPNPDVGIVWFDRQADGSWREYTVELGGVACEDLIVADLDINGHLDIVAGGRATHNIKLYLNQGSDLLTNAR